MSDQELAILIEALAKQVQLCLDHQDRLREFVQGQMDKMQGRYEDLQHNLGQYATRERVGGMEKDIADLSKRMDDMERRIIDNQEKNYKKTITGQYAILSAIVLAVVTFFVNYILGNILHLH